MKGQRTPAAAFLLAAALVTGGAGVATATESSPGRAPEQSVAEPETTCPPEKDRDDERKQQEKEAGIGDSQDLEDFENEVTITVVDVVDPAEPKDPFSAPEAGNRLTSVQFCVENTGDTAFLDPFLDTQVTDTAGQSFDAAFLVPSDAGPHFPSDTIRVSPGESALGFITYEVPKNAELAEVRYTMPFGFGGDDTGAWNISEQNNAPRDESL